MHDSGGQEDEVSNGVDPDAEDAAGSTDEDELVVGRHHSPGEAQARSELQDGDDLAPDVHHAVHDGGGARHGDDRHHPVDLADGGRREAAPVASDLDHQHRDIGINGRPGLSRTLAVLLQPHAVHADLPLGPQATASALSPRSAPLARSVTSSFHRVGKTDVKRGGATSYRSEMSEPESSGAATGEPADAVEQDDVLDRLVIDGLQDLAELSGDDAMSELVALFITDSGNRLSELGEAVCHGDRDAVQRVAHNLKGSSVNFGAQRLPAMCTALERAGAAGDVADATALLADAGRELRRVHAALRHCFQPPTERANDVPAPPVDPTEPSGG